MGSDDIWDPAPRLVSLGRRSPRASTPPSVTWALRGSWRGSGQAPAGGSPCAPREPGALVPVVSLRSLLLTSAPRFLHVGPSDLCVRNRLCGWSFGTRGHLAGSHPSVRTSVLPMRPHPSGAERLASRRDGPGTGIQQGTRGLISAREGRDIRWGRDGRRKDQCRRRGPGVTVLEGGQAAEPRKQGPVSLSGGPSSVTRLRPRPTAPH